MSVFKRVVCFFSVLFFSCFFVFKGNAQIAINPDSLSIDYANPKEYEIAGISVSGTQSVDKDIIITITGLSIGDKLQIPGERITTAIENLWKQGLFDDIKVFASKVQGKNIFLQFDLLEKPRLSKFSFKGVKKNEADDLREKINLIRGKVVTDYLIASTATTIKEHFVDKGFMNAKVTINQLKDSLFASNVTLVINIDKGKKIKIKDVVFYGNTEFTTAKLRRSLKETKRKVWYNVFNSGKYLEENYEKDKPKIIEKYNARGYRNAKIVKDTVYKVSENRVKIEVTVDEGKKFYFRNITWIGNAKYPSKELSTILGIKKGDVYNQSLLETKLNMNPNGFDISSLYMDDGYLFFQVTPVEVLVENDSIDIEIRIYEGKQAIVNKVFVSGNTKTNDHVIMREIRTKPGQLFRRSDIIRTQRELAQLGYFDAEKLNVNPVPNPANGTVDIEYIVEEKPSDQIELSGGYGNRNIVGTLGLTFNNFSARNFLTGSAWRPLPAGDGQRLSLRAQSSGPAFQSINLSFTEPWLGGKRPNSLSVSAYRTVQNNLTSNTISDFRNTPRENRSFMKVTAFSIGLGKRLKFPDDYFTLYQEINYQYYEVNKFQLISQLNTGYSNNISYKFNISRNSIDKPIFETRGSQISFTAQLTPPYSLFNKKDYSTLSVQEKFKFLEYQKYKFSAAWFTSLTNKKSADGKEARNLVLYTKAGFGFLGRYNLRAGVSPFERFYLGGSGLTGFNIDGREIIALRGYEDNALSANTAGSTIVNRFTMELRYPISLNPQATFFVLGFAEAGNAWTSIKDYNPYNLKRSAGVGLRIFLPMFGLLGFDYGWGFDEIPGVRSSGRNIITGKPQGQFHFTIGATLGEL